MTRRQHQDEFYIPCPPVDSLDPALDPTSTNPWSEVVLGCSCQTSIVLAKVLHIWSCLEFVSVHVAHRLRHALAVFILKLFLVISLLGLRVVSGLRIVLLDGKEHELRLVHTVEPHVGEVVRVLVILGTRPGIASIIMRDDRGR